MKHCAVSLCGCVTNTRTRFPRLSNYILHQAYILRLAAAARFHHKVMHQGRAEDSELSLLDALHIGGFVRTIEGRETTRVSFQFPLPFGCLDPQPFS